MKCIKFLETGNIVRVHSDIAATAMEEHPGKVVYIPKSEWKEARRHQAVAEAERDETAKADAKMKAADAREAKKEAKQLKQERRNKRNKKRGG